MPFARPTTTATPDEIFEQWVHVLSHAELLALLYVVRRTLGFKKTQDAISYTQFLHGITTRDGRVLDHGCGVRSRSTLAAALRRLEEWGLVRSTKAQTAAGDHATTSYALWFVGDDAPDAPPPPTRQVTKEGSTPGARGWYADRTTGSAQIVLPVVRRSYLQQTVETTNTTQQTVLSRRRAVARPPTPPFDSTDSTILTEGLATVTTREVSSSPVAAAVIPLSAEFGDDAPRASQTRVANMQRAAGLSDDALWPLLDDAAAIVRSKTPAITKRGRAGTIVRMPYLLATLRDLIAASDEETSPVPAPVWTAPLGSCASDASSPRTPDEPPGEGAGEALWSMVREEVRAVLTRENYATWFAPTHALALDDDVLCVAVPSPFHAAWLTQKLQGHVQRALERTGHGDVRVVYDGTPPETAPPAPSPTVPALSPLAAACASAAPAPAPEVIPPPVEARRSFPVVACPLCRAEPCRCRPAERARRGVTALSTVLALRSAP